MTTLVRWLAAVSIGLDFGGSVSHLSGTGDQSDRPSIFGQPSASASGLITGRVIDGVSGQALEDARVMLSGTTDWVLTNSDGQYAYFNVRAGSYRIRVTKPGYAPAEYGQYWIGFDQPVDQPGVERRTGQFLVLRDGERRADVNIKLWKYATIGGRILDEDGEPVVGAQVQAVGRVFAGGRPSLNTALPTVGRTDDRGIYRLSELLPGDYLLCVPSIAITSSLSSSSGPADNRWSVESARLTHLLTPWGASLDSGSSRGIVLQDGTWQLSFAGQPFPTRAGIAQGSLGYETTFFPGTTTSSAAAIVSVSAGEQRKSVDFSLQSTRLFRVSGSIVSATGSPANVELQLRKLEDSSKETPATVPTAITVSDATGQFEFLAVPPGNFRIEALDIPHDGRPNWFHPLTDSVALMQFRTDPWSAAATRWAEGTVGVNDADVADVRIVMQEAVRISGVVVFEGGVSNGPPPSAIMLELDRADGRVLGARASNEIGVDSSRNFRTIELPPGKYFIRAPVPVSGWHLLSALYQGADVSVRPIELKSESVEGVVVTFTRRPSGLVGTVAGVTNETGATILVFPVERQSWIDFGQDPRQITSARASEDGSYSISDLPTGEYYVAVTATSTLRSWQQPDEMEALSRLAERVRITSGQQSRVNLTLRGREPK